VTENNRDGIKLDLDLEGAVRFLIDDGDSFVKSRVRSFGDARLPKNSRESKRCVAISKMFRDYAERNETSRPLSIAVFGPPGSGKSFTVMQLAAQAKGIQSSGKINLSQLNEPSELTKWLSSFASKKGWKSTNPGKDTPLFFFDEFDAAIEGKELGWLKWFLAPMWDGEFVHEGETYELKNAVFIFAGGTAERFEDFEMRHAGYFGVRKGPDFVSRLAGFLDIEGLNTYGPGRYLRRALILQHALGKRSEILKLGDGRLSIEKDVLKLLLAGGHYIHGARSLEALLDMSTLTNAKKFQRSHLPPDELRKLHVSRGPLDGVTVGISAGQNSSAQDFFKNLAPALIERGAELAYGGNIYEGDTLSSLVNVVTQFPDELIGRDKKRIRNLLAYPSFLKAESRKGRTPEISKNVEFIELQTLSPEERKELVDAGGYFTAWSNGDRYVVENHLAWSLSLFRMRVRLIREVQALVVIGGKGGAEENKTNAGAQKMFTMPWGRFPGVAEEVMLALAFNIPVYVLGMSGGAAESIGHLMGLSKIHTAPHRWLREPWDTDYQRLAERLKAKSGSFEVPHKPGLPQTHDELREFFRAQGPETEHWPYNGLTAAENRDLFNFNDRQVDESAELVIRGITRTVEWTHPKGGEHGSGEKCGCCHCHKCAKVDVRSA
jgi:hypothetical protein